MTQRPRGMKKKCRGAITIAIPEGVIEVASDSIKESERIAEKMLRSIKTPKKPETYIR